MTDAPRSNWTLTQLSRHVSHRSGNSKVIKGKNSAVPGPGLVQGFSASGADVWVPTAEHAGDGIVVSAVGARCGKSFVASGEWTAIANTHVLRPGPLVDTKFLWYLTNDERFWIRSGTAQPFVKVKDTLARDIWLPPLDQQIRIVDILEGHLSRLDAGASSIATALRRLQSLRASSYAQVFRSVTGSETTLGQVARWGSGGTPKTSQPHYYGGSIPWVVSGDLKDRPLGDVPGRITDDGLRASSAKWVPPRSVLVAMYGATIGKAAITTHEVTTNQAVAHAIPISEMLSPEYLFWYLQSERPRFVKAGQGGAQPNISQTVLKKWPVVVPPLAVQEDIVARLTALTDSVDRQALALQKVNRRGQVMRSALLKAAFSGRLTSRASVDAVGEEAS